MKLWEGIKIVEFSTFVVVPTAISTFGSRILVAPHRMFRRNRRRVRIHIL